MEYLKPVLRKLKKLIVKLMQKLFQIMTFTHFILNFLILIWLVWWMISLNLHLGEVIKIHSQNTASWYHKPEPSHSFTTNSLQRPVQHLFKCYFFEVRNSSVLQTIGIPMSIYPAPFWANLYLPKDECDFMGKLITENIAWTRKFDGTFRFIDDLWAGNNWIKFQKSYKEIQPKELVLKLEHSGSDATFFDSNITISNSKISTKLYNKCDNFFFNHPHAKPS